MTAHTQAEEQFVLFRWPTWNLPSADQGRPGVAR